MARTKQKQFSPQPALRASRKTILARKEIAPSLSDDERSRNSQRIRNVIHQVIGQAFLNSLSGSR